jgi:hypothetical protein
MSGNKTTFDAIQVATLNRVRELARARRTAQRGSQEFEITTCLLSYLRKHTSDADLVANIRTIHANMNEDRMWSQSFVASVYGAWIQRRVDTDIAMAAIVHMLCAMYAEKIESAKSLVKAFMENGLTDCVLAIRVDAQKFYDAVQRGEMKLSIGALSNPVFAAGSFNAQPDAVAV